MAFAVVAKSKESEWEQAERDHVEWPDGVAAIEDEGERAQALAVTGLVVGGVSLAAGAALLLIGRGAGEVRVSTTGASWCVRF